MAHDPQTLTLTRISTEQAERAFVACAGLDPEGEATPESAAAAGECFAVEGPRGTVAVSVEFAKPVAWIVAAAGGGGGMASETLGAVESLARARGCAVIGFQTLRRGLMRVAKRRGYIETGRIGIGVKLEKNLWES